MSAPEAAGACPLCSGAEFAPSRFGLRRCARCGLVVASAVWRRSGNEELNEKFFNEGFETRRSFWVRLFERRNDGRTLGRLPATRGRLLEIGVGSGSFLARAAQCGYAAVGCDLSAAICREVSRRTGLPVHCGGLGAVPRGELFDVVVMNHVLEHVADPVALLRAARARLTPRGILHLAVPNVAAPEAVLPGWNSYEPYHLLYFTPDTLRAALERAGFSVESLVTHESFSGWFLAFLRTARGAASAPRAAGAASAGARSAVAEHAYRLAMVAAGVVTWPARRIQEVLMKGDEIVALARAGETADE